MTRHAILSLHTKPVQLDEAHTYAIVDDGPRFLVPPMDTGTGPAVFDNFDTAEEWRGKRLGEIGRIGAAG